jgi:steroid delta-isomerase-like uncharacterized protein
MSNKSISASFYEVYGNRHDVESVLALFTEDFKYIGANVPGGQGDLQAYHQAGLDYLAGFPDLRVEILDQVEEGERVVTRAAWSGTNTGPLFNMPSTGKSFRAESITIDRIVNGKIAERVESANLLSMMQQLGIIPATAG